MHVICNVLKHAILSVLVWARFSQSRRTDCMWTFSSAQNSQHTCKVATCCTGTRPYRGHAHESSQLSANQGC
jgi:hypothetical protein